MLILSEICRAKEQRFAHITDEEVKKVEQAVLASYNWLEQTRNQLSAAPKHLPPPITVAQIRQERLNYDNIVNPVVNKPVPKPAPAKEEQPADKEAGNGKQNTNQSEGKSAEQQSSQNGTQDETMEWN